MVQPHHGAVVGTQRPPPIERASYHCKRGFVQSFRLGFGNIWSYQFLALPFAKTFAFLGAWHL